MDDVRIPENIIYCQIMYMYQICTLTKFWCKAHNSPEDGRPASVSRMVSSPNDIFWVAVTTDHPGRRWISVYRLMRWSFHWRRRRTEGLWQRCGHWNGQSFKKPWTGLTILHHATCCLLWYFFTLLLITIYIQWNCFESV